MTCNAYKCTACLDNDWITPCIVFTTAPPDTCLHSKVEILPNWILLVEGVGK